MIMDKFISVRILPNEKQFYEDFARANKITLSDLIRIALTTYIKNDNNG